MLVRIALAGIPSRPVALFFLAACVAIALGFAAFQIWVGLAMLLAALWYGHAIRWTDRHGGWK